MELENTRFDYGMKLSQIGKLISILNSCTTDLQIGRFGGILKRCNYRLMTLL